MSQDLLADLDGYYQASSANGATRLAASGQRQGTSTTELRSARHDNAKQGRESRHVLENGNEVLFDATDQLPRPDQNDDDDDDEDDEFGDFQSGSGNNGHDRAAALGMVDTTTNERPLLDLDLDGPPPLNAEGAIPVANAAKGLEGSLADMTLAAPAFLDEQAHRQPRSPTRKSDAVPGIWASDPPALPEAAGDDDGWGDFVGVVARGTSPKGSECREPIKAMAMSVGQDAPESLLDIKAAAPSQISVSSSAQTIETSARPDPPRPLSPPPTTIPPPSVLLSLFPPLLRFRGRGNAGEEIRSLFENLTVAAYILAGRRLRWKRDPFLSQSTKIGPASGSGRAGGMKLTGVDKAESLKEEREVAEVIEVWRREVGTARARVAAAAAAGNINIPGDCGVGVGLGVPPDSAPTARPRVPELPPTMLVISIHTPHKQYDKPSSGFVGPGSRASKERCCALCGLTRHERVKGVDYQDEHRGHMAAGSLPSTGPSAATTLSTPQSSASPDNASAASSSSLLSSLPPPASSVGLSEIDAILGDWWIEPWGHSVCRKFWYRWRDRLRSR